MNWLLVVRVIVAGLYGCYVLVFDAAAAIAATCCFGAPQSSGAAERMPLAVMAAVGMPAPRPASENPMVMTAAESENVVILELNGVRLYVPEPWIWWDKTRWQKPQGDFHEAVPPILPDEPPGTVHRISRYITLFPRAYEDRARFPQLQPDFWVYRLEFVPGRRGLAEWPRRSLEDLPAPVKARLGPPDEYGFRQDSPPVGSSFYSALPGDVDPGGWPLMFYCSPPVPPPTGFSWCSAERSPIDGLSTKYVWVGYQVPRSDWRRMDKRVQALVEWLATPPDRRPPILEH